MLRFFVPRMGKKGEAFAAEFLVPVKKDGEAKLTYRVRVAVLATFRCEMHEGQPAFVRVADLE